ncbi:hypothetical protein ACFFRR_001641 [Megaselia abdita]
MKIVYVFLVVLFLHQSKGRRVAKRDLMDNIKYAGQMFGINTAADVATLVAKAFATPTDRSKQNEDLNLSPSENLNAIPTTTEANPIAMIASFMKLFGFDSRKLGALALNAIIMIAQMISSAFITKPPLGQGKFEQQAQGHSFQENYQQDNNSEPTSTENYNEEVPTSSESQNTKREGRSSEPTGTFEWILEKVSKGMNSYGDSIRNKKLPDILTSMVEDMETERGQGECIKMLLCKSSPFIWKMQDTFINYVDGKTLKKGEDAMFGNLPGIDEYKAHGKICEERFGSLCKISYKGK